MAMGIVGTLHLWLTDTTAAGISELFTYLVETSM